MELWEVTSLTAISVKVSSQSSYKKVSGGGIASEYSKILAEKIANVHADVKKMDAVREQLEEISNMHAELTGEVKIDEDSGNANLTGGTSGNISSIETIRRFMPDGTIMLTTYKDGKIAERLKLKPHMIVAPDYTAPPKPDGTVATELKPTNNFYPAMLMI